MRLWTTAELLDGFVPADEPWPERRPDESEREWTERRAAAYWDAQPDDVPRP